MSVRTEIVCDVCGRSSTDDRDWAQLKAEGRDDDVCPTCIAKLRGWSASPGHAKLYRVEVG